MEIKMKNTKTKNLYPPERRIDVVLDTDTFNEIDDQFAISYMLALKERINPVATYAAPFYNFRVSSPAEGMNKSFDEIMKLLKLADREDLMPSVFKGSDRYLPDESTAVISPAAKDLAERAMNYSAENPLYVVAIGAVTNIASAIILRPEIAEKTVIVWLGGHARHLPDTKEFNMIQDIAASRVVMASDASFVQLPCNGVVSEFRISGPELCWLKNSNPLADYLAQNCLDEVARYAESSVWTRVIWDVTAIGWLVNDGERFMKQQTGETYLPDYNGIYEKNPISKKSAYVYCIERDGLMRDMIRKLIGNDDF